MPSFKKTHPWEISRNYIESKETLTSFNARFHHVAWRKPQKKTSRKFNSTTRASSGNLSLASGCQPASWSPKELLGPGGVGAVLRLAYPWKSVPKLRTPQINRLPNTQLERDRNCARLGGDIFLLLSWIFIFWDLAVSPFQTTDWITDLTIKK